MADTKFEVDRDKLEVRLSRVFNATPERLWEAYTDPAQVVQWWSDVKVDKLDVREGGEWRFFNPDSTDAFRGVHKVVDKPHTIARTFEYEPMAGHIMLETVTFTPQADNQTLVSVVSKYENLGDLEGMVASGMEHGATAGLDRLAKLVES